MIKPPLILIINKRMNYIENEKRLQSGEDPEKWN